MSNVKEPLNDSLPDKLTIMAVDSSGNPRPVTYYRSDALLSCPRRIEDIYRFFGRDESDSEMACMARTTEMPEQL